MKTITSIWILLIFVSTQNVFAQAQESIQVIKGGISSIVFEDDISKFQVDATKEYNVRNDGTKSLRVWAKAGIAKPQKTYLIVKEGNRTHKIEVNYLEKGDFNATNYDFSISKKTILANQISATKIDSASTSKRLKVDIIKKKEIAKIPIIEPKITEIKKSDTVKVITPIKDLKAEQKTIQEAKLKQQQEWNKQLIEKKKDNKIETKIAEIKKLDSSKAITPIKDLKAEKKSIQEAKLKQQQEWNKQLIEKKKDTKIEPKIAEIKKLDSAKVIAPIKDLKAEQKSIQEAKLKQQQEWNKQLIEKKKDTKIEPKIAEIKKSDTVIKVITPIKDLKAEQKSIQEAKLKQQQEWNKQLIEKKKDTKIEPKIAEIKKLDSAKVITPIKDLKVEKKSLDTSFDYRKVFKNINFNEPPIGQYFDGDHFGDTSLFHTNSTQFLSENPNPKYANLKQSMDGIQFELNSIHLAGNYIYIDYTILNQTSNFFLIGVQILKLFDPNVGKVFQLNPTLISSFPVLASQGKQRIMYVTKFDPLISSSSKAIISVAERQSQKRIEFSFSGQLITDLVKEAMNK